MRKLLLTASLLAAPLLGQEREEGLTLYRLSQLAVATTTTLDIHSSWGRREANPLYGSRFTSRDLLTRSLVPASYLTVEELKCKGRYRKWCTIANLSLAAVTGVVAVGNYRRGRAVK